MYPSWYFPGAPSTETIFLHWILEDAETLAVKVVVSILLLVMENTVLITVDSLSMPPKARKDLLIGAGSLASSTSAEVISLNSSHISSLFVLSSDGFTGEINQCNNILSEHNLT